MPYKNIVINPPKVLNTDTRKESQFYRGFSTVSNLQTSKLYDADLVKQDLINHFNTRKGERVMNPEFGTIIWDAIYEPLTEDVKQAIVDDIREIITNDPRITPVAILATDKEFGILIEITMTYANSDESETLRLSFDRDIGLMVG